MGESDLARYCQLCVKVPELTLGSDFNQTIVNTFPSCQWQFGNLLSQIKARVQSSGFRVEE